MQVVRQADGYSADLLVSDQLTGIPVGTHALGREWLQKLWHGVGHGYQARRM